MRRRTHKPCTEQKLFKWPVHVQTIHPCCCGSELNFLKLDRWTSNMTWQECLACSPCYQPWSTNPHPRYIFPTVLAVGASAVVAPLRRSLRYTSMVPATLPPQLAPRWSNGCWKWKVKILKPAQWAHQQKWRSTSTARGLTPFNHDEINRDAENNQQSEHGPKWSKLKNAMTSSVRSVGFFNPDLWRSMKKSYRWWILARPDHLALISTAQDPLKVQNQMDLPRRTHEQYGQMGLPTNPV